MAPKATKTAAARKPRAGAVIDAEPATQDEGSSNKKGGSKALVNLSAKLKQRLEGLKDSVDPSSGTRLKVTPAGSFVLPDESDIGDEIQVIILDYVAINKLYLTPYNPNQITPPDCAAIGRNLSQMAPQEDAPDPQADRCASCPMNQFGSGVGNAKACKNERVLAVLLVDEDGGHLDPSAPIYTLAVSPSSLKAIDTYLAQLGRQGKDAVEVITSITATSMGNYAKLSFAVDSINGDVEAIGSRIEEAETNLERPIDFSEREQRKPAKKAAAKKAVARRR